MAWRDRLRLAWAILRWGMVPTADALTLIGADLPTQPDGQRGGPVVVDDPHPQAHTGGSGPFLVISPSHLPDPRYPRA